VNSAARHRPRPRLAERPSKFDYSRVTVTFDSGGVACTGWLYRPDRPADAPIVVMAGGLALPRDVLRPLAERFAEAGYAVFLFDYRGVGDSAGEPRNLLSPSRGITDWEEAVARVRELDGVDAGRLVLWGYSLGGAYALSVAADDPRVQGVVAVGPILSGRTLLGTRPLTARIGALLSGVRDKIQGLLPRVGPHTVPIVGDDDDLAIVPDTAFTGAYRRLVPELPDVPARSFLALRGYSAPVEDVSCPTLLVAGSHDDIGDYGAVENAGDDLPGATFLRVAATHLNLLDDEGVVEHALVFLDGVIEPR
jgi:pimeloyl-ACP methyl ester carboxylesterase